MKITSRKRPSCEQRRLCTRLRAMSEVFCACYLAMIVLCDRLCNGTKSMRSLWWYCVFPRAAPWYIRMYTHSCAHVLASTCICTFTCTHQHTHMHTHVHAFMYTHVRTCTHTFQEHQNQPQPAPRRPHAHGHPSQHAHQRHGGEFTCHVTRSGRLCFTLCRLVDGSLDYSCGCIESVLPACYCR